MTRRRLRGDDPAKTFLFHLVSIRNLASILAQGGLWSLSQVDARGLGYTNIGHQKIKDRRRQRAVPVAAQGVVADYVPFYFRLAPRCSPPSPMARSRATTKARTR